MNVTTPRRWEMGMNDRSESLATDRAQRFEEMVQDLTPRVRLLNPTLTDEAVMEAAVRMAAYRLHDEDFVWVER
jgi:hypothetical protein